MSSGLYLLGQLSARAFRLASRHGEDFAVQAGSPRFSQGQTIRDDRWTQNQREPRKCVLGRAWGNRCNSRHSTHSSRFDNQERAPWQFIVGDAAVRSRLLSQPMPREGLSVRAGTFI
jgi:hypothetical protein